jgi:hypothetical protein
MRVWHQLVWIVGTMVLAVVVFTAAQMLALQQ